MAKEENVLEGDSNARDQLTVQNQQNSPLLHLPAELRNRIYAYAFEPEVRWHCRAGFKRNSYFWSDPKPEPTALLSCMQVNFEAKNYLLTHRGVLPARKYPAKSNFSWQPKDFLLWWNQDDKWVSMKAIPKIRLVVGDDRVRNSGDGAVGLQQTLVRRLKELSQLKGLRRVVVGLRLTRHGVPVQVSRTVKEEVRSEIEKVLERVGHGDIEVVME